MLYGFAVNSEWFLDDQCVVGFWTRLLATDFESAKTPFNDAAGTPGDFRANSKLSFQMPQVEVAERIWTVFECVSENFKCSASACETLWNACLSSCKKS